MQAGFRAIITAVRSRDPSLLSSYSGRTARAKLQKGQERTRGEIEPGGRFDPPFRNRLLYALEKDRDGNGPRTHR